MKPFLQCGNFLLAWVCTILFTTTIQATETYSVPSLSGDSLFAAQYQQAMQVVGHTLKQGKTYAAYTPCQTPQGTLCLDAINGGTPFFTQTQPTAQLLEAFHKNHPDQLLWIFSGRFYLKYQPIRSVSQLSEDDLAAYLAATTTLVHPEENKTKVISRTALGLEALADAIKSKVISQYPDKKVLILFITESYIVHPSIKLDGQSEQMELGALGSAQKDLFFRQQGLDAETKALLTQYITSQTLSQLDYADQKPQVSAERDQWLTATSRMLTAILSKDKVYLTNTQETYAFNTETVQKAIDFLNMQIEINAAANQQFSLQRIAVSRQKYILNHFWISPTSAWDIAGLLEANDPARELNTKLTCLANTSPHKVYVLLKHNVGGKIDQKSNDEMAKAVFDVAKVDHANDILIFVSSNVDKHQKISIVFGSAVPSQIVSNFEGDYIPRAKLSELGPIITALYKWLPKKQLVYPTFVYKANTYRDNGCISVYGSTWASLMPSTIEGKVGCGNAIKIAVYIQTADGKWQEELKVEQLKEEYVTAENAAILAQTIGYNKLNWTQKRYSPVHLSSSGPEATSINIDCWNQFKPNLPDAYYEGNEYYNWFDISLMVAAVVLSPFNLDIIPDAVGYMYYSMSGQNSKASLYAFSMAIPFATVAVLKGSVWVGRGIIKGLQNVKHLYEGVAVVWKTEKQLLAQAEAFLLRQGNDQMYHIVSVDQQYYIKYDPQTQTAVTCVMVREGEELKRLEVIDYQQNIPPSRLHEPPTQAEVQDYIVECVINCFPAGTLVWTQNGLWPIEKITAGMKVWTTDTHSNQKSLQAVSRTFTRKIHKLVSIYAQGQLLVQSSTEHPFWVGSRYKTAQDLQSNDTLTLLNADLLACRETVCTPSYLLIDSVRMSDTLVRVYNIEVENWHTYFVGQKGVLVHNRCINSSNGIKIGDLQYKEYNRRIDFFLKDYIYNPKTNEIVDLQSFAKLSNEITIPKGQNILYMDFNLPSWISEGIRANKKGYLGEISLGNEMFNEAYNYFNSKLGREIDGIYGEWIRTDAYKAYDPEGFSLNLRKFKNAVEGGKTYEEAAFETITGKWAREKDFTKVKFFRDSDEFIDGLDRFDINERIEVIFYK